MKITVHREKEDSFSKLINDDRTSISDFAAVEIFKLLGWSSITAGIYLLYERSNEAALEFIPYILWLFIVWDISSKLGWKPKAEMVEGRLILVINFWKLILIGLSSAFISWAIVFWMAPIIHIHILANRI